MSAAASLTQAPRQERTDPPKVDKLLERFPIGTETVKETEDKTGSAVPPPAVTVPEEVSDSDSAQLTIAAVVGVVVLLMAVGTGLLLVRRQRSRGAPIWSTTANLRLLHETLATADREWHKLQPAVHSTRRRPPVTEVPQERTEPKPGEPEQAGRPTSETGVSDAADSLEHGNVVEQIGAILQSAEAAAAAIRAEAVTKAEEIGRAAVEDGKRHLAKVEEEAARIRNAAAEAAKEAQSAAESYGATQRREAEQSVRQMLAKAEAQARAMRQASEGMARQIEEEAREREEKLRAQMRPLETSLRRALDAFRGITAQLEDLLDGEPPREDENLADALSGSVQRTGAREEAPPQQERTG